MNFKGKGKNLQTSRQKTKLSAIDQKSDWLHSSLVQHLISEESGANYLLNILSERGGMNTTQSDTASVSFRCKGRRWIFSDIYKLGEWYLKPKHIGKNADTVLSTSKCVL